MANNYGIMIGRIADDLERADLTAIEIPQAIQDAIGYYERKDFYFNRGPLNFSFNTVRTQEYYGASDNAAIPTSPHIETLTGTFFGLRRELRKRPWQYIDRISTLTTSMAMPEDWAYAGEQIRFYPIPDAVYSIAAFAVQRLARPSANSDGGPWMNDAELLIRSKAKEYLFLNIIRSSDMEAEVAMMQQQIGKEYAALTGETASREATGYLEPVMF